MTSLIPTFVKFAILGTLHAKIEFAFANPILLWRKHLPILAANFCDGEMKKNIAVLDALRVEVSGNPFSYQLGHGPIEIVERRIARGELTFTQASELVAHADILEQLSPVYIRALCQHAIRNAQTEAWRSAVRVCELLVSAHAPLHVPADADSRHAWSAVREDFLQVARLALCRIPDGRILQAARRAGEELISNGTGDAYLGRIHFLIGILYLDPHGATRSLNTYGHHMQEWNGRLVTALGGARAQAHRHRYPMPSPEEALAIAETELREAVKLREGALKGRALKALLQSLMIRSLALHEKIDEKEFRNLASQAVELLTTPEDAQVGAEVCAYVAQLELRPLSAPAPPQHNAEMRPPQVHDHEARLSQLLVASEAADDPLAGIGELDTSAPLFADAPEDLRRAYFTSYLGLLAKAVDGIEPDSGDVFRDVERIAQRRRFGSAGLLALGVAASTTLGDRESLGLELMRLAESRYPDLRQHHDSLIHFAQAILLAGVAVNEYRASAFAQAINHYGKASIHFLSIGLHGNAADSLNKLADVTGKVSPDVPTSVVAALMSFAWFAEVKLGGGGVDSLQRAYRQATRSFGESFPVDLYWMLSQLAKGHVFSTGFDNLSNTWRNDDAALDLLTKIVECEMLLATSELKLEPSELGADLLVTAYLRADTPREGASSSEVLVNMRHAFDERAFVARHDRLEAEGVRRFMTDVGVRAALDRRTVLLDYFFGEDERGLRAVYLVVVTHDSAHGFRNLLNAKWSKLLVPDGPCHREFDQLSPLVADLRDSAQRDPGVGMLHSTAEAPLEAAFTMLLGEPVCEHLGRLRQFGYDHLRIVTASPLHYAPLHLVRSTSGEDLGREWIVTYQPTLSLLSQMTRSRAIARRERTLDSFGLSFADVNPYGLTTLSYAPAQAIAIANVFGGRYHTEAAANEAAFIQALRSSRYVHLSSHGVQEIDAPCFHRVYLAPSEDSDGRLHAYELDGEDLRGLEVVSLAACETALGRFDTSGNLRGLPAVLLQAGVQTIVATLWDAEQSAILTFFGTFYHELARNVSRLDAFRAAQLATRCAHHQVRDWAPFCLIGDWS